MRLLCVLLSMFLPVCAFAAQNILLRNGERVAHESIVSKDQFGILVKTGQKTSNGDEMRRFITFSEMNPASLSSFPFCDVKAVERIRTAVTDRVEVIRRKFKTELDAYQSEKQDFSKMLQIHGGVPSYQVLFTTSAKYPEGAAGFLFSDGPDAQFYGKIYLYGLDAPAGMAWIGTIYPTEQTITLNGGTYKMFTIIQPPEKALAIGEPDQMEKPRRRMQKEPPPVMADQKNPDGQQPPQDGIGPDGKPQGPPPPMADGKQPPKDGMAPDGKRQPPPPPPDGGQPRPGGKGGMMPQGGGMPRGGGAPQGGGGAPPPRM